MMSDVNKCVHLCYNPGMKLSQYAQQQGISYRMALRWFRDGAIKDTSITGMVVEYRDRLTRFGFHYLETLLETQGRRMAVVKVAENDQENLMAHLVAIVYAFTARLYGQRRTKRQTEALIDQLKSEDK
jgi:putative resolvase